ncbi:MAG: response regulator transcription factor [Actinomycetales bacterium]|nr:response regulator transcription factor [Actinomycetales bacterium]
MLVVEDEAAIADVLRLYLSRDGFRVAVETTGPAALEAARRLRPAAIVLDVGLPGMDGTEVCRRLRADGDWTPILFCTARDDEIDRILGLEMGGDDYITKPFSPREVVARVRVALRHSQPAVAADMLTMGEVALDRSSRRVTVSGVPVDLTATEFDLLEYLMAHPSRVFSREQLLSEVWGYAAMVGTRTVDVHVAQVRAKLAEASPIRTVRGVGYSAEGS